MYRDISALHPCACMRAPNCVSCNNRSLIVEYTRPVPLQWTRAPVESYQICTPLELHSFRTASVTVRTVKTGTANPRIASPRKVANLCCSYILVSQRYTANSSGRLEAWDKAQAFILVAYAMIDLTDSPVYNGTLSASVDATISSLLQVSGHTVLHACTKYGWNVQARKGAAALPCSAIAVSMIVTKDGSGRIHAC